MSSGKKEENKISALGITIWSLCALFFLYEFFLRTFLGALANQIMPSLNLPPSEFALLASAFYIAYGVMQIPVGIIGDKFGIKKSLLFACLVSGLSSFLFATSGGFITAFIYRFFMGFGGSFAFIILLITTINWFPKKYLALFVGLGQFIGTMGALIAGGPLAFIVTQYQVNWRVVFFGIGVFGFVLFILSWIFVKEGKNQQKDFLVFIQRPTPLFRKFFQLFTSKQSMLIAFYSAFIFLSVAMLGAVWGSLYLQSLGFSQKLAASIVSFGWFGFACGCPALGYISDLMVRRKPIMVFCALVGLILVCILIYVPFKLFWLYAALFFVLGITSAGQSIGFATITEHVKKDIKSIALGLNSAFITLLAALTPIIVGSIIQEVAGPAKLAADYVSKDFTIAFSVMPLLYFLALVLSLFFIEETFCRSKKEPIYIQTPDRKHI